MSLEIAKFRRNTHSRNGNYILTKEYEDKTCDVFNKYGDIIHHLDSRSAMSFRELLYQIRLDDTNYDWPPSIKYIATGLIALIECGLVVVENK